MQSRGVLRWSNEKAMVAGIIITSGCTSIAVASEARMGSSICAVAVLDVSSVRKVQNRHMVAIINTG